MCDFIKNSKKLLMEVVCLSFPRQALHQLTTIPTQVSNILLVVLKLFSMHLSFYFILFFLCVRTSAYMKVFRAVATEKHRIYRCMYICSIRNTGSTGLQVWWRKTHEWLAALRDVFLQHKGYVEKLVEIRIFHVSHLTWFLFCQSCASLQNFRFYFKALHYIK